MKVKKEVIMRQIEAIMREKTSLLENFLPQEESDLKFYEENRAQIAELLESDALEDDETVFFAELTLRYSEDFIFIKRMLIACLKSSLKAYERYEKGLMELLERFPE